MTRLEELKARKKDLERELQSIDHRIGREKFIEKHGADVGDFISYTFGEGWYAEFRVGKVYLIEWNGVQWGYKVEVADKDGNFRWDRNGVVFGHWGVKRLDNPAPSDIARILIEGKKRK